jgi:hypothetical protein
MQAVAKGEAGNGAARKNWKAIQSKFPFSIKGPPEKRETLLPRWKKPQIYAIA